MDKNNFAFGKKNFILIGIGMAIVIIGFLLMAGPGSAETTFEADIFSVRRIKVAPLVCFFGFIFMIYGILRNPDKRFHVRRKDTPAVNRKSKL